MAQPERERAGPLYLTSIGGIEITDEMVEAAAIALCDAGVTPHHPYPDSLELVAREILEAALMASSARRASP